MIKVYSYILCISILLVPVSVLSGAEKQGAVFTANEESSEEEDEEESAEFKYKGRIFFENVIDTETEQETRDAFKKNELGHNMNMQFGTYSFYIKMDSSFYAIPYFYDENINNEYLYSKENKLSRNLRYSSQSYEVTFRELFLNWSIGEDVRTRIGNQVIAWGKADVFNATSYFNPYDFREFLLKDEDETKQGVPLFSLFFSLGDHSFDFIFMPLHVPRELADEGNYWETKYSEGPIQVELEESDGMEKKPENFGYGSRYSARFGELELELSYYHGPDKDPIARPYEIPIVPLSAVTVLVKEEYYLINAAGLAFSYALGDVTLQCEGAYTFDKTGVIDQEISVGGDMTWPYEIRQSPYYAYTTGFNYFIPFLGGDTVLSVEWSQSGFADKDIMTPLLSKALVVQIMDEFFQGSFKPSINYIYEFEDESTVLMPSIKYDFQNGFDITLSYMKIEGDESTLLGVYNDRKVVSLKMSYEY